MPTREQALADPSKVNADVEAVLENAAGPVPQIGEPPGDLVRLPGGLARNGTVTRTAVIRELTGEHEEALAKALRARSVVHFLDTLLSCGTVKVGSDPATPALLKDLLIGDRDEIALGIRTATYGDTIDIDEWECPRCGGKTDLSFSLADDIERTRLSDPAEETVFEVPLRREGRARVRLPTGADQEATFADDTWTTAQRNTVLLSRCVQSVTRDGREHQMVAAPSLARTMPAADRQAIIREIARRQPGPRYGQVEFRHEECGQAVTLALGLADLFRDLIAAL